jgi:cyclophilin family peptidyl-prolyl cis-trans isomerase
VAFLERAATDLTDVARPRGWHRAAHALVAFAAAAPDRAAAAALKQFIVASTWQLRVYGARAAVHLRDRAALEALAVDADDNVVEAAVEGLAKLIGHDGDAVYLRALARTGYQAIRAAALALDGTPDAGAAIPALSAVWQRLTTEGRANSTDTRAVIAATIARLGAAVPKAAPRAPSASLLNPTDLRRLAAPRARITIRGAGSFEIALFTSEAPATVLRFASLAESGYYAGLTFHRVVPNFVVQGGSPSANEYVGFSDLMNDEVGLWPHVRGAVGLSTRGRDTGDAQFFINLVDNPRFDHDYTVFGQVLNGIDVVDRIVEGDVIDEIEILP